MAGPVPQLKAEDRIDPARAEALLAALGRPQPVESGTALPPFAHLAYFWEAAPPSALGQDGHAATGGLIPDFGLPKRMWAGGRLTLHAPFLAGVKADRTTRVVATQRKTGRTGDLAFVTLRHDIRQRGVPVLSEERDIVYRAAGAGLPDPQRAPIDHDTALPVMFDAVTLFRYSALTFNAHRIHYDTDFARGEGYDGVIVHGPLLAQSLALFAAERLGGLRKITYRARAPLYAMEPARLCLKGRSLWVRGPENRLCMTAEVER
jgi:hydroxyacyl-ACP dehydratase HTD2-like protein with hotdog domain